MAQKQNKDLTSLVIRIPEELKTATHLAYYKGLLNLYSKIPDKAIPFVFEEFQRTAPQHTYNRIHQTPDQMRDYLAHVHAVLEARKRFGRHFCPPQY
jgi:hypothetical protein